MTALRHDELRWRGERARAGPWHLEGVAYLSPQPPSPPPSGEFVQRCLATLEERGFTNVVTAALSPLEQPGFLAAGFDVRERLQVLTRGFTSGAPALPPGPRLVKPERRRWPEVLEVDAAAFDPFWRLDEAGLLEALRATRSTRFRVAVGPPGGPPADPAGGPRAGPPQGPARRGGVQPTLLGYAIFGRSGRQGFVQRLAVSPDHQRTGTGRRLLIDGLRWMRRRGVLSVMVNTQVDNEAALSLYRALGFHPQRHGLSVLARGPLFEDPLASGF